jgi:membrane-bound ClpP family serine protease
MKKVTALFLAVVVISFIAVLIEVINPHSFLGTAGSFIRVVLLLVGATVWYKLSQGTQSELTSAGTIVLLITAALYFFYGLSSFCQNKYYEDHHEEFTNLRTDIEPYSCPKILMESLFQ